jgi:hypothetical protein
VPVALIAFFVYLLGNTGEWALDHIQNASESVTEQQAEEQKPLEESRDFENQKKPKAEVEQVSIVAQITRSSEKHILWGEINRSGKAVGGHFYGAIEAGTLRIRQGTKVQELGKGIVKAHIDIKNEQGRWVQKIAKTTFFPKHWTKEQVLAAVSNAFTNRKFKGDNEYHGPSGAGFDIRMHLKTNGTDEIITAFPNLR